MGPRQSLDWFPPALSSLIVHIKQSEKVEKLNTLATNGYTAQGETEVTVVTVRRGDAFITEAQIVSSHIGSTHSRPMEAERADEIWSAIDNIATTHEMGGPYKTRE